MWYNPIIIWLLKSPFHGVISKNMMLVSYTGRKSGKPYTTPVNYLRLEDALGEYLAITSTRERTWWRNLRSGASFNLTVQGRDLRGIAEVIEDEQGVIEGMGAYFESAPEIARYYGLELDESGVVRPEDLPPACADKVFIKVRLLPGY